MESGSVLKGLFYGGYASCTAECVTMPVDVVKTRLQMDGAQGLKQYAGTVDCATRMVRAEGPGALFKGLPPALVRQSTYGSMRYGFYAPIRDALGVKPGTPKHEIPIYKKVLAGAGAGAISSAAANPTDLVKVRLQTDGMLKGPDGAFLPKKYAGMAHAFISIVREEGILGLWKGVGPTCGRATALAAAELSTYDEVKTQFLHRGLFSGEGLPVTLATSFVSGYVSTVVSSPFDVVSKSRHAFHAR